MVHAKIPKRSYVDYVYWEDVHYPAFRSAVTWIARRIYMTDDEGVPRFGEKFRKSAETPNADRRGRGTLRSGVMDHTKKAGKFRRCGTKRTRKVYWVAKGFAGLPLMKETCTVLTFFPLQAYSQRQTNVSPVMASIFMRTKGQRSWTLTTRSNGLVLLGWWDAMTPSRPLARILR